MISNKITLYKVIDVLKVMLSEVAMRTAFLYPCLRGMEIYRITWPAWCFLAVDTAFWLFCVISPIPFRM